MYEAKVIKLMEKIEWSRRSPSLGGIPTCPICTIPKEAKRHEADCELGQVMTILRTKPEAGEFTKDLRRWISNVAPLFIEAYPSEWNDLEPEIYRACAHLDAKDSELKEARKGAFGFIIHSNETLIEGICRNYKEFDDERTRLNKQLKTKDEEMEKLKKALGKTKTFYIKWKGDKYPIKERHFEAIIKVIKQALGDKP